MNVPSVIRRFVMSTLNAITQMEALYVHVNSGTWVMVHTVKVTCIAFSNHWSFYSWCIILVIPPAIILSANSSQFNIGRLREFSLTCQSVGDFAGSVVWMKSDRNVSSIGLSFSTCLLIYLSLTLASYLVIDTVDNQTVTTDILQMLYVHQLSENEAVLMTIDQFGVTKLADGIYTCIATNNLTEARRSVTIIVLGDSDACL